MHTVHNKTSHALRLPLPGHRVLHLGPDQSGEISEKAVSFAPLIRLALAGEIVIEETANPLPRSAQQRQLAHAGIPLHHRRSGVRGDR